MIITSEITSESITKNNIYDPPVDKLEQLQIKRQNRQETCPY